ncbi:hypothetical protein ACLOJK_007877 [Asimina triloba]
MAADPTAGASTGSPRRRAGSDLHDRRRRGAAKSRWLDLARSEPSELQAGWADGTHRRQQLGQRQRCPKPIFSGWTTARTASVDGRQRSDSGWRSNERRVTSTIPMVGWGDERHRR